MYEVIISKDFQN